MDSLNFEPPTLQRADWESLDAMLEGSGECESKRFSIEKLCESNSSSAEDTSKWLAALEIYVHATQTTYLEVKPHWIGIKEAAAIYKFLPTSHVTHLNMSCNYLSGGVEDLVHFLANSKIETLNFCRCMFSNQELLYLMESLKNTHVTELIQSITLPPEYVDEVVGDCHGQDFLRNFDSDELAKFISHLLESRLTKLDLPISRLVKSLGISPLLQVVESTALTNLDLREINFCSIDSSLLFSALPHSAITDLILRSAEMREDDLQHLSLNLKDSKVVNLNLSCTKMTDAGLDILATGLRHSTVRLLDISGNRITGSSSFGLCLKDSQISHLNVSFNRITSEKLLFFPQALRHSLIVSLDMALCGLGDELGQQLIHCLKDSKVTHVNLTENHLGVLSLLKLTEVLKDTCLTNVNLMTNRFQFEEVIMLGDCLNGSKLKDIKITFYYHDPATLSVFLEKTKGTSIESVDLQCHNLGADGVKTIAPSLVNTTFTHLNLSRNEIGDGIVHLAPPLKHSAITHLNLAWNKLTDADVEILANCLADTKITHLNLDRNSITDCGAKLLAGCLKSTKLRHLHLSNNRIGKEGLEALVKHAEGTFLTGLDVKVNAALKFFLLEENIERNFGNQINLDRVLLENRTAVHRFLSFFKQVAPEPNTNAFRFDNNINNKSVDVFLEECLLFYRTFSEQSSAANVIVAEEGLSFSMEQIVSLRDEFPQQFAVFVSYKIEAGPTEYVDFIKRAEELKVTKIVEFLLLNRSALMIDPSEEILHPYGYILLHKYKMPLFNLSLEPERKTQLIDYFTKHSDLEGAVDFLSILASAQS